MKVFLYPVLLVALACTTAARAGECPALSSDEAAAQVRTAFSAWNDAVERKDLDNTMSIFSQAIHFQFQGSPDFGYARLLTIYSQNYARENAPHWRPLVEYMIPTPGMVTLFSEWHLIPAGGGDPISEYRGVDVFQREADCAWRITASLNYAEKSVLAQSPGHGPGPAEVNTGTRQPLIAAKEAASATSTSGPR